MRRELINRYPTRTRIDGLGRWRILSKNTLNDDDVEFIKTFNPTIYWNDCDCMHWAFDTKLPSGSWLEHMRFSPDLRYITAIICN